MSDPPRDDPTEPDDPHPGDGTDGSESGEPVNETGADEPVDPTDSDDRTDANGPEKRGESGDSEPADATDSGALSDPSGTDRTLDRSETHAGQTGTVDGPERDLFGEVAKRLAVAGVIVVGVLVLAAIAGALVAPEPPTQSLADAPDPDDTATPFAEDVLVDRIAAEGNVTVDEELTVEGGNTEQTVVIEETGAFQQSDIRPLVRATTMAGHEVRLGTTGSLEDALDDADAYVLVEPRLGFDEDEVEAITDFTDRGGRLIVLGNPDRTLVGPLGSIETSRTDARTLMSEYGIVFGNRYLYDTVNNDANHRQVFAESTGETDLGVPELELDQAVLSTATRVESRDGTVLLRTPETTKLSGGGGSDTYPVAVADGNVLAVGDTAFLTEENHNVADNEELVAYAVEFALGA